MSLIALPLLLVFIPAPAATQPLADTTITVQGFIQQDPSTGAWTVLVPLPLEALGVRTFVLAIQGRAERWSRFIGHYVEVKGRVWAISVAGVTGLGIDVDRVKETEPPGTARHTVGHGFSVHGSVSTAVIPNRFAWIDAHGNPTGVNPFVSYTISGRQGTLQETPIFEVLPTNDLLCVHVRRVGSVAEWDSTTQVRNATDRGLVLDRAGMYRDGIQLPRAAAPVAGRYAVRIGICQIAEYEITAEFEVQ